MIGNLVTPSIPPPSDCFVQKYTISKSSQKKGLLTDNDEEVGKDEDEQSLPDPVED